MTVDNRNRQVEDCKELFDTFEAGQHDSKHMAIGYEA